MARAHNKSHIIILLIVLAIISGIAVCAIVVAFWVQRDISDKTDADFTADTTSVTQDILKNITEYDQILYNVRAFVVNDSNMSQAAWKAYFDSKNILDEYPSISSISYAEVVSHATKQTFIDKMRTESALGGDFTIHPAGDRDSYLVARLVVANNDIGMAYGFDGFSTDERRDTYRTSETNNRPQASQPLTFATGHLGFFVAMPVMDRSGKTARGFIVMSFRAEDFLASLYRLTPDDLATKITDVTDSNDPIELFESSNWEATPGELTRTDTILFAGRTWEIGFASSRAYHDSVVDFFGPRSVLAAAGMLILSIAFSYFIIVKRLAAKSAK